MNFFITAVKALLLWFVSCQALALYAQTPIAWDDTYSKHWPKEAKVVHIPSSKDGAIQSAYYYQASNDQPRPLVVSLHTWSGNFQQRDTLVNYCIEKGFHYIHPDFRGPNQTKQALGSELVVSDIDDAISYAIEQGKVDLNNIHVIGVSGGGHATVLTYMKSKHMIRSFSAYVGIYNLIDWYHESMGRQNKYGHDILAATSEGKKPLNIDEAKKRSPFYMATPTELRQFSKLNLYVGIHDGYTGSVPVAHTLKMYNKVVQDFQPDAKKQLIPEEYMHTMVKERSLPGYASEGTYLGRKILYQNTYKHLVNVLVFEGTHEMPAGGDPLQHIPSKQILAIGDSNGAMQGGWVDQLQALRPQDVVVNTCRSGNTIGFDNLGTQELNTLKNVERYLSKATGDIDAIVVMLGTNDSKAEFKEQATDVVQNMAQLVARLKALLKERHPHGRQAAIYLVSPPPYGEDAQLAPKYQGGAKRVTALKKAFESLAKQLEVHYIDTHTLLKPIFPYVSTDGVHLTTEGQMLVAKIIQEQLK